MKASRFSEDVHPISEVKLHAAALVDQTRRTRRPVLLTRRGRPVAVLMGVDEYGFEMLYKIVLSFSPQLGGNKCKDSQEMVASLAIEDGKDITTFHHRATLIDHELRLAQDKTGQRNRLLGKYIELLFQQQQYHQLLWRYTVNILHSSKIQTISTSPSSSP